MYTYNIEQTKAWQHRKLFFFLLFPNIFTKQQIWLYYVGHQGQIQDLSLSELNAVQSKAKNIMGWVLPQTL